jgi:hypothetical protein
MFYSSDVLIPFFCRAIFFDDDGNILEDVHADPVEVAMRKKISDARNMFEDLIHMAKQSNEGMDFLTSSLSNLQGRVQGFLVARGLREKRQGDLVGLGLSKRVKAECGSILGIWKVVGGLQIGSTVFTWCYRGVK